MADARTNQTQVQSSSDFIPAGRGFATKSEKTICVLKLSIANIQRALAEPDKYVSVYTNRDGAVVQQLSLLVGRSDFQSKAPFYASLAANQVQGEVPGDAVDGDMPESN